MAVTTVRMIDTIGQNLDRLAGFPYWQDRPVMSYTTRRFAATLAQRARFKHFFGIDQAPGASLFGRAAVKDVESGAAFNSDVAALARAGAKFVAYTFMANYHAMRRAIGSNTNVHYWIADWTASESAAIRLLLSDPLIVAVQWASPSFGGGIVVPGTSSTLRQLNVDLSIGRADFWLPAPPPPPKPVPRPKPVERAASGTWAGDYRLDPETGQWTVGPQPGKNVKLSTQPRTDYAVVGVDLHTGAHHIKGIDRATGASLLG